uniref:Uncharacterized protein n=1 Tax=Cacopsylla melanoneura TaxID=428564 RepID=A0A8D9EIE8_9HEMI
MLIHGEWEGEEPPEDTLKVVARMGNELGIKDPLNDVFQAYRGKVPKETNCKPIWVHMIDQKARDKWVAAYNHKDNWRIFHHEDWYLTGRLQPPVNYTGELNPAVKKWAKKKKYKTHMEGVHVYYRKNKTSDIFRVTNMEHLGYLKNKTEEHKWEIPVKTHDGIEQKKYMNSILKHF